MLFISQLQSGDFGLFFHFFSFFLHKKSQPANRLASSALCLFSYFPMQKRPKMVERTSSPVTSPVMVPRW